MLLHASTISPNRNCAQLKLPSGSVHNCSPRSSPATPAATNIGRICSSVGCAVLASLLLISASIFSLRSSGLAVTASFSASSKLYAYLNKPQLIVSKERDFVIGSRIGLTYGIVPPLPLIARKSLKL
jgi:hypothetical protein